MEKSDLKTGMLVQTKKGEWFIVQLNTNAFWDIEASLLISVETGYFFNIYEFRDTLEHIYTNYCDHDIIKIAKVDYLGNIFQALKAGLPMETITNFKIIWERQEGGQEDEKK